MRPEHLQDMFQGMIAGSLAGSALVLAAEGVYATAAADAMIFSAWLWFLFRPICLQTRARGKS